MSSFYSLHYNAWKLLLSKAPFLWQIRTKYKEIRIHWLAPASEADYLQNEETPQELVYSEYALSLLLLKN